MVATSIIVVGSAKEMIVLTSDAAATDSH